MSTETELLEEQNKLLLQQTQLLRDLNRALQEQSERMAAMGDSYGQQSRVVEEANAAVEDYSSSMFNLGEQQSNVNQMFSEGAEKSQSFGDSLKSWLNKSSSAAASGLSTAIDQLTANFSALTDVITNPLQAAFGFLFTAFDMLMEKAVDRIREFFEFRDALERVRKEFGSFTENTSGRIYKSFTQFNSSLREAAGNTGVFASKFSMGMQGTIERLEMVAELAGDMGATFDVLGQEFNDATAELYVLKQGLLFSGEALKNVSVMSIVSGKSLKQFSNDTLASVNKIGRQLGISSKVLGQDVGKFLSNFKSLGKMTGDYVTEITKAASYTRKLGIELNELIGLNQKFDDFEQGAEAAAQLAAAFGMVLDPVKLIQAQNPADVLSDLQKAFAATGRSFETLSRQDKALLASQSGLTEEQAALAFSAKGLSLSYDEIRTSADGAMKSQKSQEEIMRDLADSIENVITPIEAVASFFKMFLKGFEDALMRSGPVQATINALATALLNVYYAGMRTFTAFLKIPGVNAVFTGLLEVAKMVGNVFDKVATKVEEFVVLMSTDPKMAAKNFVTGITDVFISSFNSIFSPKEGGGPSIFETMIDGLGQTFMAVAAAIPGLILGLVKSLKSVLTNLTKIMRDSFKKPESGQPTVGQSLFQAIKDGMNDLIAELPSLMPILIEFGTELITFVGRAIQEFPFATLFVAGGPILTAASGIFNQLKDTVIGLFSDGGTAGALTGAAAKVNEGTQSQEALAAALNKQGAAMTGDGPNSFNNLVGQFGGAATKAAEYAAVAFGIALIGESIIKLMRAVLEPPKGETKSIVDLMVAAGTALGTVSADGLSAAFQIVGGVIVAAIGGVAAIMFAMSKVDMSTLVVAAAGTAGTLGLGALVTELLSQAIPVVSGMIKTMMEYVGGPEFSKQIEGVKKLSTSIKQGDIDSMNNLGSIFSSIGTMMGNLLKVGTGLNSFPSVPKEIDGKATAGEESASGKLERIMGYVSAMIGSKSDKSGIVGIISKFEETLGTDLTSATQKFQAIAMIMDPMSKMMSTFGTSGLDFIKTISAVAADGSKVDADAALVQVRDFIGAVGSGAADILLDINTRINLSKEQVDTLSGKLSLISTTSTFLGTFGQSMKQLLAAVQTFDTSGNTATAMKSLQSFLFGNEGGVVESDMESIPVEAVDGVIPIMMKVMSDIAAFINSDVATVDPAKFDMFTKIFSASGSLSSMITAVSSGAQIGQKGALDAILFLHQLNGSGNKDASFAAHLYSVISEFSRFDQINLPLLARRETNMKGAFNVIGSYIEGLTGTVSTGTVDRVKGSLKQLQELRQSISETAAALDALDLVTLDAAIEGFGANMNVVKKKFEINGGKVQINVNMNVTMNAQRMAETLVIDGFVQASQEFGDYVNSPESVRAKQYDYYTTEYNRGAAATTLPARRDPLGLPGAF
jgi:hypothetical protein